MITLSYAIIFFSTDIVLYLCEKEHIEGGMIFQLLEDLTEMSTMRNCKDVFGYIESKQDILGKVADIVLYASNFQFSYLHTMLVPIWELKFFSHNVNHVCLSSQTIFMFTLRKLNHNFQKPVDHAPIKDVLTSLYLQILLSKYLFPTTVRHYLIASVKDFSSKT